jgi:diphosphomevalonate decarboxylase
MERCRDTSPLYQGFHQRNAGDLQRAIEAIAQRNVLALGEVAEDNCLAMHNVMHKAVPPVNYFLPGTHEAIAITRQLRADGVPCFFSIDAGPNVKIFFPPEYHARVLGACQTLQGLVGILEDPFVP